MPQAKAGGIVVYPSVSLTAASSSKRGAYKLSPLIEEMPGRAEESTRANKVQTDAACLLLQSVACHAKRKKLTRKTKKTLLNITFKSVFCYL